VNVIVPSLTDSPLELPPEPEEPGVDPYTSVDVEKSVPSGRLVGATILAVPGLLPAGGDG
jgi:hypothetical protein